jgi:hypothetical protein
MVLMLNLSEWNLKTTMINVPEVLIGKTNSMQQQIGNIIRNENLKKKIKRKH